VNDIIIKKDFVETTIIYRRPFTTHDEMIDAVNGAVELRGLASCEEEEEQSSQSEEEA
jgi:hypothetical protein